MTLIYRSKSDFPYHSLTVPNEAVRGLRGYNGSWKLYVSDPEPMSVSVFLLTKQTLEAAASAENSSHPFSVWQGKKVWDWLLHQSQVEVRLLAAAGMPSMFPSTKIAGPKPDLELKSPQIEK
jgi:hypothetical protein